MAVEPPRAVFAAGSVSSCYDRDTFPVAHNDHLGSSVYRARDTTTGETVALKHIPYDPSNHSSLERAKVEVGALVKLGRLVSHPHLISSLKIFWDKKRGSFWISLPWAAGGTLYDHIVAAGSLSEAHARQIFAQLVSAVHAMHSAGVIHRDLKPANILMRTMGAPEVMVADFGFALLQGVPDVFHSSAVGTLEYMAPELLVQPPRSSFASDIWALGVILYNMISGRQPFEQRKGDVATLIREGAFRLPRTLFGGASSDVKDIIRACMAGQAERRPTTEQLLAHPWVRQGVLPTPSSGAGLGVGVGVGAGASVGQSSQARAIVRVPDAAVRVHKCLSPQPKQEVPRIRQSQVQGLCAAA